MRIPINLAALAAIGFLSACNSDPTCTAEDAARKSADLSATLQEMAATDPAKLDELAPKVQEMAKKAPGSADDLQAACKAMDEMMAELTR